MDHYVKLADGSLWEGEQRLEAALAGRSNVVEFAPQRGKGARAA